MRALWIPVVAFHLGCGNLTAGGYEDVEVYASGDADEAPSPSPTASSTESDQGSVSRAPGPYAAGAGLVEGTLEASIDLALLDEGGGAHTLNVGGPVLAQVDLQGLDVPLLVEASLPEGRYTAVRLRFTEVTADVEAGLLIGGVPYVGPVSVDIGLTPFEVHAPVTFELEEGTEIELLLDLNSDEWLLTLNVVLQTVAAADFGASLAVTVR
jgi:hypothetical protein